jgi:hypothetical protein
MSTKPETGREPSAYTPPRGTLESPTEPMYPKASPVEDAVDIFYAPSQVFARRERSGPWMVFLIVCVIAAIFAFVNRSYYSAANAAEYSRAMAARMAANPQMTSEQVEAGRAVSAGIAKVIGFVFMPILIMLVALVTWLGAKALQVKVGFEQSVLIVSFAMVPRLLDGVSVAVQNLLLDSVVVNSMFTFSLSAARFLDPDATNGKLYGLASRLDIPTLWATLLIGIGVSTIGRVPRAKGFAVAGIAFVVGSLPILFR